MPFTLQVKWREFKTAAEALGAICSDREKLPEELKVKLGTIETAANRIATLLNIDFEASHGTDTFCKVACETIAQAKKLIESIPRPPANFFLTSETDFEIAWGHLPNPPKSMADGPEVMKEFDGLFRSLHRAIRIAECTTRTSTIGTNHKDAERMREAFDEELQNAQRLVSSVEARVLAHEKK